MKKHRLGFLYVAIIVALSSCTSNTESPDAVVVSDATVEGEYKLTTTQFNSSEMQLGKLEMKAFHEIVKATGMIDVPPENRASVSTYFGGSIKNIPLLPGEQVNKGQVLFTLENPEYVQIQQDYLEASGQLNFLKSDYERQKSLIQDNVTSQKKYLKAESDYTIMNVKVESLSKKLTLMGINPTILSTETIQTTIRITSPISGYVTSVNVNKGSFLSPSQTALSIVNTDHLHLELKVFEKDLIKVETDQPILFKLLDGSTKEHQATVHLVNKSVDPEDRTVGIHGHLSEQKLSSKFNPGMYVEADILTTSESKAALPQEAIVELEGKYFVLVLVTSSTESYTFMKKEVNVGSSINGYVQILNANDFKDNSEVLVKGAFNLITE